MVLYFGKLGVSEEMLLEYLQVKKRDEIDADMVFELRGLANAIKEGTTTVQEAFVKPVEERRQAEEARKKAEAIKAKATQAQKKQTAKAAAPKEVVDEETGEVKTDDAD